MLGDEIAEWVSRLRREILIDVWKYTRQGEILERNAPIYKLPQFDTITANPRVQVEPKTQTSKRNHKLCFCPVNSDIPTLDAGKDVLIVLNQFPLVWCGFP